MKQKRKHKCCKCNNIAKWLYLPSGNKNTFFCDNCVPRGCTCNILNIEEFGQPDDNNVIWWTKYEYNNSAEGSITQKSDSFYYDYLDDKGRRYPCCEYIFDEEGFDIEENIKIINKEIIFAELKDCPNRIIINKIIQYVNGTCDENGFLIYDKFMRKVYDICYPYMKINIINLKNENPSIIHKFKSNCYKQRKNL